MIQNQFVQINTFSVHQKQANRGGDPGHIPIHNSLIENKISGNQFNQKVKTSTMKRDIVYIYSYYMYKHTDTQNTNYSQKPKELSLK